ncbi:MAG: hypothetical protein GX557_12660 [Chloroflexi bacterium]|nr:hypothetical protein [Chloroflexota bacterium]
MRNLLDEIRYDVRFVGSHRLQPTRLKIAKVVLLVAALTIHYLVCGSAKTLIFCAVFFGLALLIHLLYRAKTL